MYDVHTCTLKKYYYKLSILHFLSMNKCHARVNYKAEALSVLEIKPG